MLQSCDVCTELDYSDLKWLYILCIPSPFFLFFLSMRVMVSPRSNNLFSSLLVLFSFRHYPVWWEGVLQHLSICCQMLLAWSLCEMLLTEQKPELLCVEWQQRPGRRPEREGGLQSPVLTLPSAAACDFWPRVDSSPRRDLCLRWDYQSGIGCWFYRLGNPPR